MPLPTYANYAAREDRLSEISARVRSVLTDLPIVLRALERADTCSPEKLAHVLSGVATDLEDLAKETRAAEELAAVFDPATYY